MARKAPSAIVRGRLRRCRRALADKGLGSYLVTNRYDHYYLTGFTGEDSAVLITRGGVHIISDGRFESSIKLEAPWARVSLRKGQLVDEIATVVRKSRLRKLAVDAESMSIATRDALRRRLKGVRLIAAPPIAADLRVRKDDIERAAVEEAVRIAEAAYRATLKTIRVGQTEIEIAARLEYEMKKRGSTTPAFDSIVAVDGHAALPHAVPGKEKVKRASTLLLDWGATFRHYRSDLTRTVFVGSIPAKMERVYKTVLEAQKKAIAAIRPGARMCDVDAVARRHITDAGYGDEFNHGLGHGLGLNVHEPPSLRWSSPEKLRTGMLVTVEPGVYLPGIGGVRIEDDVLVTPKGCRVLSHLKKSLPSAVLPLRG